MNEHVLTAIPVFNEDRLAIRAVCRAGEARIA